MAVLVVFCVVVVGLASWGVSVLRHPDRHRR